MKRPTSVVCGPRRTQPFSPHYYRLAVPSSRLPKLLDGKEEEEGSGRMESSQNTHISRRVGPLPRCHTRLRHFLWRLSFLLFFLLPFSDRFRKVKPQPLNFPQSWAQLR